MFPIELNDVDMCDKISQHEKDVRNHCWNEKNDWIVYVQEAFKTANFVQIFLDFYAINLAVFTEHVIIICFLPFLAQDNFTLTSGFF